MKNQNETTEMVESSPPFNTPYLLRPYGEEQEAYGTLHAAITLGLESISPNLFVFGKLDPEIQVLRAVAYAEHLTVEKRLGNTFINSVFDRCMLVLAKHTEHDLLRNQMTRQFYYEN